MTKRYNACTLKVSKLTIVKNDTEETRMIYGYVRVSTAKQKVERQIYNIKQTYPDAVIIDEAYTGTSMERPKWCKLIKAVKPGDTIVFDEVSRMARTAEEGVDAYMKLYSNGINLVFLKEPHISTEVYRQTLESGVKLTGTDVDCVLRGINEYLMILAKKQIEIAFNMAEQEVDYLHMRIKEGIARRKAAGEQVGREGGSSITTQKEVRTKEIIKRYSKDFQGTLKDTEVIKLAGVTRNTYYKYKKKLLEENTSL